MDAIATKTRAISNANIQLAGTYLWRELRASWQHVHISIVLVPTCFGHDAGVTMIYLVNQLPLPFADHDNMVVVK